jgi:hypothetical protein
MNAQEMAYLSFAIVAVLSIAPAAYAYILPPRMNGRLKRSLEAIEQRPRTSTRSTSTSSPTKASSSGASRASYSYVGELLKAGVKAYKYNNRFIHAKTVK